MGFTAEEVNKAFKRAAPELYESEFATYPIKYDRWLQPNEEFEGKPMFVASETDQGMETDYVFCKNGTHGKGYYHLLTKTSYVNLCSKLVSTGSGTSCCFGGDATTEDAWDTAKRICYNRSRASKPDDAVGMEQAVDCFNGGTG